MTGSTSVSRCARGVIGPVLAAAAASFSLAPSSAPVAAQSISVIDGDIQGNTSPTSYDAIFVSGTGTSGQPSTYNADASLFVSGGIDAQNSGVFNVNADTTVGGSTRVLNGRVNLNSGILTTGTMSLTGAASLGQFGGSFATASLTLAQGATATVGPADQISQSLALEHSSITLQTPLALTSGLLLSGSSTIQRTAETISAATGFSVSDSSLDLVAGDSFLGFNSVGDGGRVTTALGATVADVLVEGTNASGSRSSLVVADSIALLGDAAARDGGMIELVAGTLSCGVLGISGSGALQRTAGTYAVNVLRVEEGASVGYGEDDLVSEVLISGSGSLLEATSPLALDSLTIADGVLRLDSFTGTGAVPNWGLSVAGDVRGSLEALLAAGRITAGTTPVLVIYDSQSAQTFVTAVPEPSTWCMAAIGLAVGGWSTLRRRVGR